MRNAASRHRVLRVTGIHFKLDKFTHSGHKADVCRKVAEELEGLNLKVIVPYEAKPGDVSPLNAGLALLAIDLRDRLRTLLAGSCVDFCPEDFEFNVGQQITSDAGSWWDNGAYAHCAADLLLTYPHTSA